MKSRYFSYPARRSAKKRIFLVLLIAAVAAAGFFLRKKPYEYPFMWSQSSPEAMTFEKAVAYCGNLTEKEFNDWRLPTLFEIKTLESRCLEEENNDFCAVTDSCEWDGCENELCGRCLKYEESVDLGSFWTATENPDGKVVVFIISTEKVEKNQSLKSETHSVKCVRELY